MPALRPPPVSRAGLLTAAVVMRRALVRLWGRDVMLYVGGVSFFALLAVFPALTILVGVYATVFTPEEAAQQAAGWAWILPPDAQELFQNQVTRLTTASRPAVSAQSAFALTVGAYAAFRGVKALLAGLSFIHEEDKPRGFVGFNVLSLIVAGCAVALVAILSTTLLTLRMAAHALGLESIGHSVLSNEWTWAAGSLTVGFTLLYRYGMSSEAVGWRASSVSGATAALLSLGASALSAIYVDQIVHLGATYGAVGAVMVFLIWLSWNVNAVFFGGALATETELALHDRAARRQLAAATVNVIAEPGVSPELSPGLPPGLPPGLSAGLSIESTRAPS